MTANRISSDSDRTWVDGIRYATQIAITVVRDTVCRLFLVVIVSAVLRSMNLLISLGSVFLLELSEFAMVAACAFRAEEMPSLISCRMASKVMAGVSDVDFEEDDGEWICFLGGSSSSGTKKYRGSNSNDGGNTGDGVKIAGGVIGSSDEIDNSYKKCFVRSSNKIIVDRRDH
ncbi:hypothetical protein Tco_0381221 [Tanacetum coccineum]